MTLTIEQLAEKLSAEVRGDLSLSISGAQNLEKSREGQITFVSDEPHARSLKTCQASAVLMGRRLAESLRLEDISQTLLIVADARQAFLQVLETFHPRRKRLAVGVSSHATVHPSAQIGKNTNIHPGAHIAEHVVIGENCDIHAGVCIGPGCRVGDETILYPNVVLYPDVRIGRRVMIHAGAVIGTDGFGYQLVDGAHQKIPHYGTVQIEDDVEIGANSTIDRALVGVTLIGRGTKIDNLVMVAHNCELGRHNILASQVGFAGSVTTGDYVVCAGQVGIADHVHVGTKAVLAAKAGVPKSVAGGKTYFGSPAQPIEDARKQMMAVRKLPKMREQLRELARQIRTIQSQIAALHNPSEATDDSSASAA